MPIRPENKKRYPKDWNLRRRFIIEHRAKRRCEWCGVDQYAVGHRIDGTFHYAKGNYYLDSRGYTKSFKEAKAVADYYNKHEKPEHKNIVIVLTIAHIHDDRPEAASLLNLAALCQQCHNRHDVKARQRRRKQRQRSQNFELPLNCASGAR